MSGATCGRILKSDSNYSEFSRINRGENHERDEHHIVGTIGTGDADLFVRSSNGSVKVQ
jgi:hypothetical protein